MTVRRILVPIDFSEHSDAALAWARQAASTFGASLHLLHVVEEASMVGMAHGLLPPLRAALFQIRQDALERLRGTLPVTERAARDVRMVVRIGRPSEEIVSYAQEACADLVVMGTHGRGGLAHLILGSVAEKVVRAAPCPVTTIRRPLASSRALARAPEAALAQ